jgi:hypothetical protein
LRARAAARNFNCPNEDSGNTIVTWDSELGVTYHVQMTAVQSNFAGTTTLTFTGSTTDPVVTEVEGQCVRECVRRPSNGASVRPRRIVRGGRSNEQ